MKVCVVEFYSEFHNQHQVLGVYSSLRRAIVAMVRGYVAGHGQANAIIRAFEVDAPDSLIAIEYSFGHMSTVGWMERVFAVNCIVKFNEMSDKELHRRFMDYLK